MDEKIVGITHILREGNQLANHYANVTLDDGEIGVQGRRPINNDKLNIPFSRIISCKR